MFAVLTLTATPLARFRTPRFTGPIIRATLGAAIRRRECTQACGDGGCRIGSGCGYTDAFEPPDQIPPPYRIDASDMDHRSFEPGEPWTLQLVCFRPHLLNLYRAALHYALAAGLGSDRVPQQILEEHQVLVGLEEISERALGFLDGVRVILPTPTEIKKKNTSNADPTLHDVLHASLRRLHKLGFTTQNHPRFEPNFDAELLQLGKVSLRRWSTRQGVEVPIPGIYGAWNLRPTPAQAWWLAMAELTGVGKGTAMGMGVVQVIR